MWCLRLVARTSLVLVGVVAAGLTLWARAGAFPLVLASTSDSASSSAVLAEQFATRLSRAGSDADRYQVLLGVMNTLNVGVYTSEGRAVVRGAERGPRDFYLYDFELEMMARSLGRKQTRGLPSLTKTLNLIREPAGGQAFAPETVRDALLSGTRRLAQTPNDRFALPALLVRELALRHSPPYDTLRDVPAQELQFDALQAVLILSEVIVPVVRGVGPIGTPSGLDTDSPTTRLVSEVVDEPAQRLRPAGLLAAQQDTCQMLGDSITEGWSFGKWLIALQKNLNDRLKFVAIGIDGLHGSVLAYSVEVHAMETAVGPTHYGHISPGKELRFRIQVVMLDDLGDLLVKCGWILGVKFPKKGPIPGVKVLWEQGEGNLKKHGELQCGFICTTTTGVDGIATLVFKPKNEILPGIGMVKIESGAITGTALYLSAEKNVLGFAAQLISPKEDSIRWLVERHKARGYKFKLQTAFTIPSGPVRFDDFISSQICGEDPLTPNLWKFHWQRLVADAPATQDDFEHDFNSEGVWPQPGVFGYPVSEFKMLRTDPGRMSFHWEGFPPFVVPATDTVTAPIEENETCPEAP